MFDFGRIVHKMSLIHYLTEFCDQEYKPHCQNDPCLVVLTLLGNAVDLVLSVRANQLSYRRWAIFINCQNYIYYYTVKYSWKYASEIMYALKMLDFSKYPQYQILSLGCGNAPDLMAFDALRFT